MRMLAVLVLVLVAVSGLVFSVRGPEPASAPPAGADSISTEAWPCSAYSEESGIDGVDGLWSYRLCGRGSEDRRIELRFRGPPEASDSIEYRVWLAEPVDCDAPPWHGPARLRLPGPDRVSGATLGVAFAAYRGELWLCARSLRVATPAAWLPRRARHGGAI